MSRLCGKWKGGQYSSSAESAFFTIISFLLFTSINIFFHLDVKQEKVNLIVVAEMSVNMNYFLRKKILV